MKKLTIIMQPITVLLLIALLVLVILDLLTYAWNTNSQGTAVNNGGFRVLFTSFTAFKNMWNTMNLKHKIALNLHLTTIPVIITMIIIMSLAMFTRVIRKRIAIVVMIISSWVLFALLVANVILRVTLLSSNGGTLSPIRPANSVPDFGVIYHYDWQMYVTLASLIVAFLITQIIAFGGWVRPMTTMLSFDGHFQRYDYPRIETYKNKMVAVKELDSF